MTLSCKSVFWWYLFIPELAYFFLLCVKYFFKQKKKNNRKEKNVRSWKSTSKRLLWSREKYVNKSRQESEDE